MISKEKVTKEEFVDKLKKSKYLIFRTEFDDVKIFISGFGNKFKIVKVKNGNVKTSIDGVKGYKNIDVNFLKYWFDEYKLIIE